MAFLRRFKRLPNRLKTTYLILILVVIFGIGTFFWAMLTGKLSPSAAGESASFYLSYEPNVQVNRSFSVDIYVNTELGASKIAVNSLHYDPNLLDLSDSNQADGIQIIEYPVPGMMVTQNIADTANGLITYVLETGDTPFSGQARIASARFTAKAEGGAQFSFDFDSANPTVIGDCDVVVNIDGTDSDILKYASTSLLSISGVATPDPDDTGDTGDSGDGNIQTHRICFGAKKACVTVSGPGENECSVYADCLVTPPAESTPENTSTPEEQPASEEITEDSSQISQSEDQAMAVVSTPIPTPSLRASIFPTPINIIPDEITPPADIEIAGIGISKTMSLILFIGTPLLITLVIFLVWYYKKKKKGDFLSSSNKEDDDDEII